MDQNDIPDDWDRAMRKIADWATTPDSGETGKIPFCHIQGRAITSNSCSDESVPVSLWMAMPVLCPEMLVIHVFSAVKAVGIALHQPGEMFRKRMDKTVESCVFRIVTLSYASIIEILRANSIPPTDSAQPEGWEKDILPSKVLFVVDVDPDFSVDFALALVALATWTAGMFKDRPGAAVRLATMSSEPLHPVVSGIFQIHTADFPEVPEFLLEDPILNVAETVHIPRGDQNGAMSALTDTITRLGAARVHTAVCFRPRWASDERLSETWELAELLADVPDYAGGFNWKKNCRVIFTEVGLRLPEKLIDSEFVHIITSDTRARFIFDSSLKQLVRVNLKLSASERAEQSSWADRIDCRDATVVLYKDAYFDNIESLPPRIMDVANSKLGGFMAGLAQFTGWNIKPRSVFDIICQHDSDTVMIERLIERKLVHFDGPNFVPRICLPNAADGVFSHLLPLVDYDDRVAQFLSVQSSSPKIALIKVQIAALILVGVDDIVGIFQPKTTSAQDVLAAARCGPTGLFANRGIIWRVLGLIKTAFIMNPHGWDDGSFQDPDCMLAGGQVTVDLLRVKKVMDTANALTKFLTHLEVEVPEMDIRNESGHLSEEDFLEISCHLHEAYVHQIAYKRRSVAGAKDSVSSETLQCSENAQFGIDWDLISQEDDKTKWYAGIYTSLIKTPKSVRIRGWTWIPSSVESRRCQ